MFTGWSTGMCIAFGAGVLVGAGAGCWATSTYYDLVMEDDDNEVTLFPNGIKNFNFAA
jgi:hypothetical protein|tara:strand:- start:985 stop:1158 length:174 start_codon:yes stop_codon:yes gene_type:complete